MSQQRSSRIGFISSLLFSLSLALFAMQAISADILSIPLQVWLVWLVFTPVILFRPSILKQMSAIFSRTQWVAIGILGATIFIRSALDGWYMVRFGQLVTGAMIAMLGGLSWQSYRERKTMLLFLAISAVMSSVVAILQYFNTTPSLWTWTKYVDSGYIYGSTGLENTPVSYSFNVLGIGTMLFGSWLIQQRDGIRLLPLPSSALILGSLMIAGGLLLSKSRSGLLGFALAMVLVIFTRRALYYRQLRQRAGTTLLASYRRVNPLRPLLLASLILLTVIVPITYGTMVHEIPFWQDVRTVTTWRAYLPVIWDNPLGLAGSVDSLQSLDAAGTGKSFSDIEQGAGKIIAPHNLLLSTGIAYGPLAAIALFILYSSALLKSRKFFSIFLRTGNWFQAFWILLLSAVNIAIITHSWFHNASIAMGEMRNWLWLGVLVAQTDRNGNAKSERQEIT